MPVEQKEQRFWQCDCGSVSFILFVDGPKCTKCGIDQAGYAAYKLWLLPGQWSSEMEIVEKLGIAGRDLDAAEKALLACERRIAQLENDIENLCQ